MAGRRARLKLHCKGHGPCEGTLQLKAKIKHRHKTGTIAIGHARYTIAEGKAKQVNVRLNKRALRLLRSHPRLVARLSGQNVKDRRIILGEHNAKAARDCCGSRSSDSSRTSVQRSPTVWERGLGAGLGDRLGIFRETRSAWMNPG